MTDSVFVLGLHWGVERIWTGALYDVIDPERAPVSVDFGDEARVKKAANQAEQLEVLLRKVKIGRRKLRKEGHGENVPEGSDVAKWIEQIAVVERGMATVRGDMVRAAGDFFVTAAIEHEVAAIAVEAMYQVKDPENLLASADDAFRTDATNALIVLARKRDVPLVTVERVAVDDATTDAERAHAVARSAVQQLRAGA